MENKELNNETAEQILNILDNNKESKEEDFNNFSKNQLVNELQKIVDGEEILKQKQKVDILKSVFYKKQHDEIAELADKFIEDGGAKEDFNYELDDDDKKFKELLKKHADKRKVELKKIEEQKEANYEQKLFIIDEINKLINTQEILNVTFEKFRDLQNRWKEIKLIPQTKANELNSAYHLAVEKFYDYVKINNELRNYDFKKNLEAKQKIIEKTIELDKMDNVIEAFKILQTYHEEWKEIGPVSRELREEIWTKFKEATSVINKKHAKYFEELKKQYAENLEQKTQLCTEVEKINEIKIESLKEWNKYTDELKAIQEKWRTIGMVPKKDNDSIYKRFKDALNIFFEKRKEFFNELHEKQNKNLEKKLKLCEKAEELAESTDWNETTKKIINLQKQWKEIGSVPRKFSDKTWKRFRTACDKFFNNKEESFKGKIEEQEKNLETKKQIIANLEKFEKSDDVKADIEKLKQFQIEWNKIGYVPTKAKQEINKQFYGLINKFFEQINVETEKAEIIKFELKVEALINDSKSKFDDEKLKLQNLISKTKNDILQLENNIGFFGNNIKNNKLVDEVKKNIEKHNKKLELLNKKYNILKFTERKFKEKSN